MPKKSKTEVVRELRARHSEASRAPDPSKKTPTTGWPQPIEHVLRRLGATDAQAKERDKKFGALRASLSKKYKGEVFTTIANGTRETNISAIKSGWQELDDLVTGETDASAKTISGTGLGWPRGRIIEIYGEEGMGKTSLSLHIIAAFQRAGEMCAFVDAEHALDVTYAAKLGVDLTTLMLNQPDQGGEQALDIVTSMADSGVFGCIVVDSVAALTPLAELELDFEDSAQPGGHARLMSRALRKLVAVVARHNTLLVFINQTRLKIGVRFGNPKCLHQDTPIPFVDGSSHTIREVVEKKLVGPVWAFSEVRGFYPAPIAEHHYNGKADPKNGFLTITSRGPGNRSGVFSATVSPTHKFLTREGWRSAYELFMDDQNDQLITKYENRINGMAAEFFRGMMCGDVHLKARSRVGASIKLQDSKDMAYLMWKRKLCAPWLGAFRRTCASSGISYETPETFDILNAAAPFGGRRDPIGMLRSFSWLSMAVWLMDDGHFDHNSHQRYILSVKRLRSDLAKQREISDVFNAHGLDHAWSKSGAVIFTVAVSRAIAERISPFVPACMRKKLPNDVADRISYDPFVLTFDARIERTFVDILEVRNASARKYRSRGYYDISVPDGHDYLAGGVGNGFVVHNTTSGGQALKFYASVRMEMVNVKTQKKSGRVVYRRTRIRTVKNKCAPPFRDVFADLAPSRGIIAVHGESDFEGSDDNDD